MPYVGEIRAFASPMPAGWLPCDGRLLKIRQHQVLYSTIGTLYGGNGQEDFALPDLRGRVTAAADPKKNQHSGDTSGRSGKTDELIPFAVVNWAIAVQGVYPR
jgi:microcystin-dependent protein